MRDINKEKVLNTFNRRTYFRKYVIVDCTNVISTSSLILCKCPEHGEYTTRYSSIDRSFYCGCRECAKENSRKKSEKTCLERYGVTKLFKDCRVEK